MIETKEKECLLTLFNINRKLRDSVYNYLNFFSLKTDDFRENYLSYRYNTPSVNANNNERNILKINENFLKIFENELRSMNSLFEFLKEYFENYEKNYTITNKHDKELFKYYEINKYKNLKNIQNKEVLQRSDLMNLIFKNMIIIMEDSIIRDSVKSERKLNYFLLRNKYIKLPTRQNNDFERHNSINDNMKEYIKTNFKESKIEFGINIINIPPKNSSKFRILSPYNNTQQINPLSLYKIAQINIKLFPFHIIIQFNLNKELVYKNHKYLFNIKDEYNRQSYSELILIRKIKYLIQERIESILNLIYEEKKRKNMSLNNNSIIVFDEETLKEFLKKFINYINDYNKITNLKCNLCQKRAKYSYMEKCFLPPFYKLYKEKEILPPNNKNENDIEQKLFFHEECFRKMANSFL